MLARRVGATLASSGVLGAVLYAGWAGAVVLVAVVAMLVGALCWVLADSARSGRLTRMLMAWHTAAASTTHRVPRHRARQATSPEGRRGLSSTPTSVVPTHDLHD